MYTWVKNVGQYHEGIHTGFAGARGGSSSWLDTESTNYANNLNEEAEKITDNTNKNNIKVVAYEKDGKSYMRVGPFNWSFTATMSKITVNDQKGTPISGLLFSSFNGNNETWYNVNNIQSGKDFYISVPMNTDITKITKITGQVTTTAKAVNIWFLQSKADYKQNLIIREPYEVPLNIETTFDYNISTQGKLKVIKVNKDNETVKLQGVGFYIQHKNTGKYVKQSANGSISYVDKKQATEFITDKNGEILVKNLVVGTYIAYETKNPNYGYEILTEGQEKEVVADKTNEIKIGNKQIYVKLSGYVWVDKTDGKRSERNDLFKTEMESGGDDLDILFNGVTVRIKDRTNGQTVKETVTSKLDRYQDSVNDGNGEYLFMDVLIEKLKDYYIEFEYDGLTYTNVIPHIDQDRGSKAAETEAERTKFNQDFSIVEGESRNTGYTRDANGNRKYDLAYNLDEAKHEATLINNGQYKITANTDVPNYKIRNHFTYGQEEIKYNNLGLYEREQPDIGLVKDLENVRLTINGYEHTYIYSQRYLNEGEYGDGFNVGVKFGNKYGDMSYTRAIYQSDYDFINEADKSKELKAYVTYHIKMKNQSPNLTTKINNIAESYDKRYEMVKAGTGVDEKGNIVGDFSHHETTYNEQYTRSIIETNTTIEAQQESSIYVQFVLNRQAVLNILNNKENLNNVAEINSYSIYHKGNIYAGVDLDSNPGNNVPGDTKTYEDDTDSSPALKLEVADAREMAGKVFLDETTGELKTGQIRQGSGAYEEGEKGISGVDVTLIETTGSGKTYKVKTDANGDFLIQGYIPGDYNLVYTWGDQTYTVQNYKGTIYDSTRDQNNKKWYKENIETRLNDAIDNYNTRLEIDKETETLTGKTQITKTKMDSSTPIMGIGVEYETTYTPSLGDRYTYRIENIDFGIVERARQDLELSKRIKTFKVSLPNGQVIVDLSIDEKGNITGNRNGITYMKPDPNMTPSNGFIRLELDNELMQGAVLEVGYGIKVNNRSELDYLSENYYKYGKIEGEVVTIAPAGIVDYLDKNWAFDSSKNPQWETKTIEQAQHLVSNIVFEHEATKVGERTILYTEALKDKYLKPKETAQIELQASKMLTTTNETTYDNEVEIAQISKTGGSKTISTPGNYVPGTGKTEADDAMAETAIITSATGENRNYILPIMIGVTMFVILGTGVVIIKKKVLK